MPCDSIIRISVVLKNADKDRLKDALKELGHSGIYDLGQNIYWNGGMYDAAIGKIFTQGARFGKNLDEAAQDIVRQYGAELMKFQAESFGMRVVQIDKWEYELEKM